MTRSGRPRSLLAALLMLRVLSAARRADATPTFPSVIASTLGLSAAPPCTICHETNNGGAGTAIQPFAVYLKSRGLKPFDEGSLRTALQAAQGEAHDTNGNGVTDIDELKRGQDPNAGLSMGPAYGCGASLVARPVGESAGFQAALFAAIAVLLPRLGSRRRRTSAT